MPRFFRTSGGKTPFYTKEATVNSLFSNFGFITSQAQDQKVGEKGATIKEVYLFKSRTMRQGGAFGYSGGKKQKQMDTQCVSICF
jgi:hypothetical protein